MNNDKRNFRRKAEQYTPLSLYKFVSGDVLDINIFKVASL